MTSQALELLDCPCVPLQDEAAAIATLDAMIKAGKGGYAVAINAEKILFYSRLPDVRSVIDRAALPYPDGFGAVLALKWLHRAPARKINMPIACLEGAQAHGWRVFLIGASEEVSAVATNTILQRYPGIQIVGRMDGYQDKAAYFAAVEAARPDLVMVALGSPRQELFASELIQHVPGVFIVGCGGALDILAGKVKRAPEFMIHGGLEWLYRLAHQPWRWRRQKFLPVFFFRLVRARFQKQRVCSGG